MSRDVRYCKFCGEQVSFLPDFEDHYCEACLSFQTTTTDLEIPGKKKKRAAQWQLDQTPPPTTPPYIPDVRMKNLPIFRHSDYLVIQKMFSFRPIYYIYNLSGQRIGECNGEFWSIRGEFTFLNNMGHKVASVIGNRKSIFFSSLQDRVFQIKDHRQANRGQIKAVRGFLRRKWQLFDAYGNFIGQPSEKWFWKDFTLTDSTGNLVLKVYRKAWSFRDQFRITVGPAVDPLIALAFVIVQDFVHTQESGSGD